MPSFDVVSKTDLAEVDNALNGVEREIKQRFDLANTKCAVVRSDDSLTLTADDAMKMTQVGLGRAAGRGRKQPARDGVHQAGYRQRPGP